MMIRSYFDGDHDVFLADDGIGHRRTTVTMPPSCVSPLDIAERDKKGCFAKATVCLTTLSHRFG